MLARLPDWEPRLIAMVNARRLLPFTYGGNDCAVFARLAVEAVTGTLFLADVECPRGKIAAAKFMLRHGWQDVEEMATALLGAPVDAAASRRGDIVSTLADGDVHLAVRAGNAALAPGRSGLAIVPTSRWRRAWKVG